MDGSALNIKKANEKYGFSKIQNYIYGKNSIKGILVKCLYMATIVSMLLIIPVLHS